MNLTKDFEELFGYLSERRVRALVVGGHAVAFHAKPRYTKDIDVFVDAVPKNAERLLLALADFGFGQLNLTVSDFLEPEQIIQLGVAPNRVDFLTTLGDVSFTEAWATKIPGRYGSQNVFYIGKEELIRAKKAAGRPQDLLDIHWLEEALPPRKGR